MTDGGPTAALAALYDEHAAALHSFVRRYTGQPADAEDVVQETMLRAWRHVDRIDAAHGNPRAYLFTVARNVLTDRWRAESVRPVIEPGRDALENVPTEDATAAALERWLMVEALQRLSTDHGAVVRVLYFQGCTVAEAARLLGVPPGTVKSRSYYALRALRGILDEMGVLE